MSITENTAGNTAETALVALAGHVDPARSSPQARSWTQAA